MNNSPQGPPLNSGHVVGRQQWHERCKGPAMTVRHNMLIRNRTTSCPVNTTSRTQDFHLPLALKVTKEPRDRVFWPRWTVGNYDKKPMILCEHRTSSSSEQSTKRTSRRGSMQKVCSFYSFWEIHEVRKGLWAFFPWLSLPGADWLGGQKTVTWK